MAAALSSVQQGEALGRINGECLTEGEEGGEGGRGKEEEEERATHHVADILTLAGRVANLPVQSLRCSGD